MNKSEKEKKEITAEDITNIFKQGFDSTKENEVFKISISLDTHKTFLVNVDFNDDTINQNAKSIAETIYYLTVGSMNTQILSAMSSYAGNNEEKRQKIIKIVKEWERRENKPCIDPLGEV